ncbi:peptidoglycan-associated lipoprotein [candidate division KSB3 bacterium]|uniref:Peptidoglycan-associated lipoprotein n=1 Tax=candidate division KSB3 bacterium TaxID=2044937 RepID=A0A2G6EDL7_9BACT|nr:MAG: peptidoglycan-associated lipoprotein [candidate division KSB3 bacterium]PIE31063.1 MAG: peptidoglycan-associated lipoprotein [candidate division KSB3 bacterium]
MTAIQKSQKTVLFLLTVLLVLCSLVGCATKKPTPKVTAPPMTASEAEAPTIIDMNSRVSDMLKNSEIPEESLGELSWLPQRPPIGMRFQSNPALQTVYFEFDKYSLTRKTRDALDANAEWLNANPAAFVQIEGHCDERGTLDYNQVLGENRAVSAKKYLVRLGINPDRIFTISYGETMPADLGHSEAAWAKNRRADFKVGQ